MKHGPITRKIIKWLEKKGWEERPEPTNDKNLINVAFRFAAGGEFGLNCLLMADESATGMLTISAAPDFSISESNIDEVRKFCGHFRKQYGNIYVIDEGALYYIHSRSIDSFEKDIDDVPTEIENMIPWEREIYVTYLQNYLEKKKLEAQQTANALYIATILKKMKK
jgi:hypothetical protein